MSPAATSTRAPAALIVPHGGGGLKPLLVAAENRASELDRAATLRPVPMTSREVSDVLMLAMAAYTPLDGFMGHDDWSSVCTDMKLSDGTFWPIPITLSQASDVADDIAIGEQIALADGETGAVLATMTVTEKYRIDKALECREVFRTNDPKHPGVEKVMAQGDVNIAGPVRVLSEGDYPETYPDLYVRPAEARALFTEAGVKCRQFERE